MEIRVNKMQENESIKTWQLFTLIIVVEIFLYWISQNFIMTREVYHKLLSGRMDAYRIDDYIMLINRLNFIGYFVSPLIVLIRITFIALLIQFPLIVKFIDISFSQLFRIVCFGYISFIALTIIKYIWIIRLPIDQFSEYSLTFIPLSLSSFLDPNEYPKTAYGILGNFNLFELAWCTIVATGLVKTKKLEKIDAILIVAIVWVAIVLFLWALTAYLNKMFG